MTGARTVGDAGDAVALLDAAAYQRRKRELVGGLRGHVLEIGVGRGANFVLLHPEVRWTGLEPHRATRTRLLRDAVGRTVLAAPAESIPLPDGSVDAVLATVVLCSVRSPERAVAEVCRVLRPGGRFVFFEHVAASPGSWRRARQRLVAPISRLVDRGCDPSRETWSVLGAAPFRKLHVEWFELAPRPVVTGPHIAGHGVR